MGFSIDILGQRFFMDSHGKNPDQHDPGGPTPATTPDFLDESAYSESVFPLNLPEPEKPFTVPAFHPTSECLATRLNEFLRWTGSVAGFDDAFIFDRYGHLMATTRPMVRDWPDVGEWLARRDRAHGREPWQISPIHHSEQGDGTLLCLVPLTLENDRFVVAGCRNEPLPRLLASEIADAFSDALSFAV